MPFVAGVLVSKWCPRTKMYDALPVSWSRSGAPAQTCTMRCRCLGLEVVPQHKHVRFVAGVLVSKWCPSTKMYDLLPVSWSRSGAPALRCAICCRCLGLEVVPQHKDVRFVDGVLVSKCPSTKMYVLLPVSWSRSGAPARRCTICCRCLGLEVVPQH